MKLLMSIYATVGNNDPVKIQGIISVRSFDDPKIEEIYNRFFKDNNNTFKALDCNVNVIRELCVLDDLTSDQLDTLKGNIIRYSKAKGITGRMRIDFKLTALKLKTGEIQQELI